MADADDTSLDRDPANSSDQLDKVSAGSNPAFIGQADGTSTVCAHVYITPTLASCLC